MKRILITAVITMGCAGLLIPLLGAVRDDYDMFQPDHGNLYARFFLDPKTYPNQPQPTLEELDSDAGIPPREAGGTNAPAEPEKKAVVEPEKKKEVVPEKKPQIVREYVNQKTLKPLGELKESTFDVYDRQQKDLKKLAEEKAKKEEEKEKQEKDKKELATEKTSKKLEDEDLKRRTVFNINLMVGGSVAYYKMNRVIDILPVSPVIPSSSAFVQNEAKGKYLGISPGLSLTFIFNVAKYFALGFGGDANYFHPYKLSSVTTLPLVQILGYPSPNPQFYLEVPVYGLMRFYFSEKFRAAYLSLGAGVDFFLLGRPFARSIIARGGIGFTLNNGFTMEFDYQYNTDLAQESSFTNIKDMHRGMVMMGYCFNIGGK